MGKVWMARRGRHGTGGKACLGSEGSGEARQRRQGEAGHGWASFVSAGKAWAASCGLEGYGEDRQAGLGMLRLGSFGMAGKAG